MLKNTGCKKRADHFLEGAFSPPLLGGQPSIPLPLYGWGDSRASRPSQQNPGSLRFTHRAPPRLLTEGAQSCDPNKVDLSSGGWLPSQEESGSNQASTPPPTELN